MFESIFGHLDTLNKISSLVFANPRGFFLFSGSPNVGKRTVAFEAAKKILCLKEKEDGCACESCQRFGNDHPDFFQVGREEKIKTGDIDGFMQFTSVSSFISPQKVAVFDNLDDITWEASNRLLKIFEEVPKGFTFFGVTSNLSEIPWTIQSRSISFEFSSLKQEDVTNIIWKKLGFGLPEARVLGWVGISGNADVFSKAGVYLDCREKVFQFAELLGNGDLNSWLDFVDKIPNESINAFSEMLMMLFTDVLLASYNISDIINADKRDKIESLSQKFEKNAFLLSTNFLNPLKSFAKLNVDPRTFLKRALIKVFPFFQKKKTPCTS